MIRLSNDRFILESREQHGDRYDYSLVEYKNNKTKVKIICKEHGVFEQMPYNHLKGSICRKCSYENISKRTNKGYDLFIEDSVKIHGDRYDYSLVEYKNNKTKVKIICKEHGMFEQRPDLHLYSGCIKCVGNFKKSKCQFIEDSVKIHGDRYDYSLVEYKNNKTKVKIICKEHGVFEQIPKSHINESGCWKCKENNPKDIGYFIEKSNIIHNNRYDYSKSVYINALTKLEIVCSKHGSFFQKPNKHITSKQGCPKCKRSKGVDMICRILDENNIKYKNEKTIKGCVSENNKLLYFDIFVNDDLVIEYDGEQHFIPIKNWGGEENLKKIKARDSIKDNFCKENNIKLHRISCFDNIEQEISKIISLYLQ
jgi:hypothetical protein